MKRFAELFERLDRTTSTTARLAALRWYFEGEPPHDAAWGLYFLIGEKLRRLVPSKALRLWCRQRAGVDRELFAECYAAVGDSAETIALLIDAAPDGGAIESEREPEQQLMLIAPDAEERPQPDAGGLAWWVESRLESLRGLEQPRQIALIDRWTGELTSTELFLVIKMLTGAMRIGVSRTLVERALSQIAGVEQAVIAHRLSGAWTPGPGTLGRLLSPDAGEADRSRPYPFFLASPAVPPELPEGVASEVELIERELGSAEDWIAEWKWDGIRAQLIVRDGAVFLWSRGDENLTERFPEVTSAAAGLADGVLDGELLCWDHESDRPLPFGVLQRRIGRTAITPGVLRTAPAVFLAYDLLEHSGADTRERPIEDRLELLDATVRSVDHRSLRLGERFVFESWTDAETKRSESRSLGVEGLMLKRRGSVYRSGRRRGDWWKWKIDPMTIDAVLTYAQPGSGRRAGLLTDYTFAVWDGEGRSRELVTVTKAYSGLTDDEFRTIDRWLRANTLERFGPVRRVEPAQVFELAFEGVQSSERHRAGIALRFPRMKRWRTDKPAEQADTLDALRAMMQA
ncbi:MAG: ATP-dependent DNA ligase [Planctomycetota bacterium]